MSALAQQKIEKRKFRRRRNIIALAITYTIIIYYLLNIDQNPIDILPTTQLPALPTSSLPISFGSQISIKKYDINGALNYDLHSKKMDQYDRHETMEAIDFPASFSAEQDNAAMPSKHVIFYNPLFKSYDKHTLAYQLHADKAIASEDGNRIDFLGSVDLVSQNNGAIFSTKQLMINTKLKQALSSEEVLIQTQNSQTTAIGLQSSLLEEKWELLSEVNSVITP